MSTFTALLTAAAGMAEDVYLLRRGRSIGGILPQVVMEESHRDELEITRHPVAGSPDGKGNIITDHAFKLPAQLRMKCGWSQSGALYNGMNFESVQDVYQELLLLQVDRQPFRVVTRKRTYNNMLMRTLRVDTDARSEYALYVEAEFQEILIVQTQQTTLAPRIRQQDGQHTAPPVDKGTKQAAPIVNSSAFHQLRGS